MASKLYDKFKADLASGVWHWDDGATTVTALLVDSTSTYAPADTHNFLSDFTANGGVELAANASYARKAVGSRTVTRVDGSSQVQLGAANLVWTALNDGTVKAVLLFRDTGTASTSDLIAYIDSGGFPVVTNGGDLDINWNASGIATLT